jgi:DNA-directed RNA polymerase subunit RPC12/RpoP
MRPAPYTTYECPACDEEFEVSLPVSKYAVCANCQSKLEIHPDAEFERGMWHDRTTLSVVTP